MFCRKMGFWTHKVSRKGRSLKICLIIGYTGWTDGDKGETRVRKRERKKEKRQKRARGLFSAWL